MKKPQSEDNCTDGLIHTTISPALKKRLLIYGKGYLNTGIENLIKIADNQKITITIITEVTI